MSKLSWGSSTSSWALESEEAEEAAAAAAAPTSSIPQQKFNQKGTTFDLNELNKVGPTDYDLPSSRFSDEPPRSHGYVGSRQHPDPRFDSGNYNVGPRMHEGGNWGSSKKQNQPASRNYGFGTLGGVDQEKGSIKERPRLVLEPRKSELGGTGKSLFHSESVDQKKDESGNEGKGGDAIVDEETKERKKKVNPFGDARPREVLLEEKGKDWRKIDFELEFRKVVRSETEEEKKLKEEISNLKLALSEVNKDAEGHYSLCDQIAQREKELEQLVLDFDDKVRFAQKATSFSGRRTTYSSDRQLSQSNMYEENLVSVDKTRSRGGKGNSWGKPTNDRRGFQGGKISGYVGNRNNDRSRREGW